MRPKNDKKGRELYFSAAAIASTSSPNDNPQGVFYYTDNDNTFLSKFKIPDFDRVRAPGYADSSREK